MHGLNEENLRPWSLNALEWFATHLPMLEYLETNFDTYTIHTLETPLARSLVPISLVLGFLTLLHEKDWWHIAAYISCVYPNAKCGLGNSWDSVADEELRSDQLHWRYVARAVAKARADNC
ncbi:uncharacterized protein PHACADRAFT_249095 [Phanerochaete carnosa HHB-10118-sp]|uniref:Uncharacterized protein n=1 Tax=Phanerochaete carnosa (strain HHB-10118-sp) TaxID=650164 RepID=K5WIM5_PHACS|nr:uncharacterized protein PHACADRAFT_249095 [Phanerochaete carnosa HHB-10118-sp]EKM58959.1 hypothetical protein PHACADRAFT_249095 [Phanerochaete carnosa HHB-10118-sp]